MKKKDEGGAHIQRIKMHKNKKKTKENKNSKITIQINVE